MQLARCRVFIGLLVKMGDSDVYLDLCVILIRVTFLEVSQCGLSALIAFISPLPFRVRQSRSYLCSGTKPHSWRQQHRGYLLTSGSSLPPPVDGDVATHCRESLVTVKAAQLRAQWPAPGTVNEASEGAGKLCQCYTGSDCCSVRRL